MVKPRKTVDTWKKKEWYNVIAPKMFENKTVASTPTEKTQKLIDRVVKVPLSDLTGNMHHQFFKLMFRTTELKGKDIHTEFDGFEMVTEMLRRNIRRRRSMIKAIVDVTTKDKKKLRVSVYVFTAHQIDTSKKNEIRKLLFRIMAKGSVDNYETLVQKYLFGNTVTEILREVKKIIPIRRVEIAKCKVIREAVKEKELPKPVEVPVKETKPSTEV